jgi:hypothetical protein
MNNLETIAADVSGYCDVETGECVVEPNSSIDDRTPEDVTASGRARQLDRVPNLRD